MGDEGWSAIASRIRIPGKSTRMGDTMTDEERFQTWLDKVCARELPTEANQVARIEVYARELAEGVDKNFWSHNLYMEEIPASNYYTDRAAEIEQQKYEEGGMIIVDIPESQELLEYIAKRWNKNEPHLSHLEIHGYVISKHRHVEQPSYSLSNYWQLTKAAFELLNINMPSTVFISYSHRESSALALLIYQKLVLSQKVVFVDKDLNAGDNWHTSIEENVRQATTLILLLSKNTLKSEVVSKEIQWALEAGLNIIPVWHNGFRYKSEKWQLTPEIDRKLSNTQAIVVKEESALGYDTAITELLNCLGITP